PGWSRAYVANLSGARSAVFVIDTAANAIIALVDLPQFSVPCCVAVTPDGSRVYTANLDAHSVSVIDPGTNTVTATVPVEGGPTGVAVTPDGSRVYVTLRNASADDESGAVAVIDAATNTVTATIPAGSFQQRKNGDFVFKGMIMGIPLEARISPRGDGSYSFKIEGAGAPNLPTTSPFPVGLTIGNDTGSTTVNTNFGDEGNWQTRGDN